MEKRFQQYLQEITSNQNNRYLQKKNFEKVLFFSHVERKGTEDNHCIVVFME